LIRAEFAGGVVVKGAGCCTSDDDAGVCRQRSPAQLRL
jgi:hypothetical protein